MSPSAGGGRGRGYVRRASGFDHSGWLGLVEVSGPFLSVPVLRRAWPAGLDSLDRPARARLRAEHADYFDVPPAERDREHWIRYVLAGLLGWSERIRFGLAGSERLTLRESEHDEVVTPSFGLAGRGDSFCLLGLVSDGPPTGRVSGSGWAASPADRLARLLRAHDVPLGLATDGRWWVLVWAPPKGATTQAVFDASLWREERDLLRAFVSLLSRTRFFGVPDEETLPALLERSQDNAEEITEALGIQVRRAVELLIGAIGRAGEEVRRHRPDVPPLEAHEAYVGAVTVMMRLVFLLFAEERHLLPNDDPVYQAYYSAGRLVDELERRASEPGGEAALEFTGAGWHRLLALFRAIHGGVNAGLLHLPPYDGSLFDPGTHPWLEGRFTGEEPAGAEVLGIDDRTVLHMLRAVQYVEVGTGKGRERRRLSFATLDVEQIGYVYEGLLGFDAFRADDDVLGLTGRPGEEEEVALTDMEDHAAAVAAERGDIRALAERLSDQYKDSGIGSPSAVAKKLTPLTDDELSDARRKLLSATGSDPLLADRLLPFYRLLRLDLSGLPTVFSKGTMYVTESPLRRFTGTHYTPRFLAEQVVEGALEPLAYSPGPLQTADAKQWKLRSSTELLGLKIADIAVGSAAFLVAASRYLGARLIEAWIAEGDERVAGYAAEAERGEYGAALDAEIDPVVIEARRLIIEHCLYGVDINPMAVEMAKLSMWLTSMDPSKPFTFVDDKFVCGDSLLGITSLAQLEWMHLDVKRGRKLHENIPWAWNRSATQLAIEVAGLREQISRLSDSPGDYVRKRELLADAQERVEQASQLADLVTGAALAEAGKRYRNLDPYMMAADLARIAADRPIEGWNRVTEQADEWLNIDHIPGSFARTPLHWPLVFPEVFLEKDGFDAIIGNPPFLGGSKLTGAFGIAYREHLVEAIGQGVRGNADLVSYFVLRAHVLINLRGQAGLIATNTLAQGDSRRVGLDQLIGADVEIWKAIKSRTWPSRSAVLEYAAVWTSRAPVMQEVSRLLDDVQVKAIAPSLDPMTRVVGNPWLLKANSAISFEGSKITGIGFTMEPDRAQELIKADARNADALFPYLNGHDLNSRPDCSASRWVINFRDWPEGIARKYRELYSQVLLKVKPERMKNNRKVYRDYWWQYAEKRPGLLKAISELDRVIVLTRHTNTVMPLMVPTGQVFSDALTVFATEDTAMLALLSSTVHFLWAASQASSIRMDLRYTPSDVFETFPLPELTQNIRDLGDRLNSFRQELMLARHVGLTKMYNLVHGPKCADPDIEELRETHRRIDHMVAHAYRWDDLDLDHGFYETRQGIRFTVGPVVRQEILDRLLELNHERYAAEVAAGLHDKKRRKGDSGEQGELFG